MKRIKRVLAYIICAALFLTLPGAKLVLSTFAEDITYEEQKVYSNATIDDEFADNYVISKNDY